MSIAKCCRLIFILGLVAGIQACKTKPVISPPPEKPPVVQPQEVVLTPERASAAAEFQNICEKKSQLKKSETSKVICACIVRNHISKLELAEVQTLIARYRVGRRKSEKIPPAIADADQMLILYDQGVAKECAKDPAYRVPEVH